MKKLISIKNNAHLIFIDTYFRALYDNFEGVVNRDGEGEIIFTSGENESNIDDDVALLTENYIDSELAKTEYIKNRVAEYQAIDNELLEALVEKELGDSTKWEDYVGKRDAIKTKHPKPE